MVCFPFFQFMLLIIEFSVKNNYPKGLHFTELLLHKNWLILKRNSPSLSIYGFKL